MEDNDKSNMRNRVFLVGFIIVAIASIVVCILSNRFLNDKNSEDNKTAEFTTISSTEVQKSEETSTEITEALVSETEVHTSPMILFSSATGKEIPAINEILDKNTNKTFKLKLNQIALDYDELKSFTAVFYSEDGISDMGVLKGGFGISVNKDCPYATADKFYQPEDFSIQTNGAYCEVKWEIPTEIREYIDISSGELMVGYWWSDIEKIRLERIVCDKLTIAELPVDNVQNIELTESLNYTDPSMNTMTIPLSEVITENGIPQYIELFADGQLPMGKLCCEFAISTSADKYDGLYREKDMVIYSDTEKASITWIIPDEVKESIDYSGNLQFSYWWSNNVTINVNKLHTHYSYNSAK